MKFLSPEFTHQDHRRTISQLFTAPIHQVNRYDVKKDAVLGDHYHKETREYFLITKGSFIIQYGNYKSKLFTAKAVNKGDYFVVEPYEKHTIECMSQEGQFLTFLTKS